MIRLRVVSNTFLLIISSTILCPLLADPAQISCLWSVSHFSSSFLPFFDVFFFKQVPATLNEDHFQLVDNLPSIYFV